MFAWVIVKTLFNGKLAENEIFFSKFMLLKKEKGGCLPLPWSPLFTFYILLILGPDVRLAFIGPLALLL